MDILLILFLYCSDWLLHCILNGTLFINCIKNCNNQLCRPTQISYRIRSEFQTLGERYMYVLLLECCYEINYSLFSQIRPKICCKSHCMAWIFKCHAIMLSRTYGLGSRTWSPPPPPQWHQYAVCMSFWKPLSWTANSEKQRNMSAPHQKHLG
jgi:hypothetical protein